MVYPFPSFETLVLGTVLVAEEKPVHACCLPVGVTKNAKKIK